MMPTSLTLQSQLMREYYADFSKYAKGRQPERKVAWVSSFTPVEILESLGMEYIYPESYAAIIAACKQEQPCIHASESKGLSRECCSYSCCFDGCLDMGTGPRGLPPSPDILIATNNQCGTLPNWWNELSIKLGVPLVTLDYPGGACDRETSSAYVRRQYQSLIGTLEDLCGRAIDVSKLDGAIDNSVDSIAAWKAVLELLQYKQVSPTTLFDMINFLITARCRPETAELYRLMRQELLELPDADSGIPVYWAGYPLWYHADRYPAELMDGFRIVGADYLTWWCLDYTGSDALERLFNAYNYTFLNLPQQDKDKRLSDSVRLSGAQCAIVLHNKSCKSDYASAVRLDIPTVELETDMIDRSFMDEYGARERLQLLKEMACSA